MPTDATVSLAAAICLAGGVNTPREFEQVSNYVFSQAVHFTPVDKTGGQPADINGVGAALVAGGFTTAYWLERVSNIVLTYPYYRTGRSGEQMHGEPWG